MKRFITYIFLSVFVLSISAQAKLAIPYDSGDGLIKNTALITLLLMQYKGDEWYRENILEPYYINYTNGKLLKYIVNVYFNGEVRVKPVGEHSKKIKDALAFLQSELNQKHYIIYHSGDYLLNNEDSYIKIINSQYHYALLVRKDNSPLLFSYFAHLSPLLLIPSQKAYQEYKNQNNSGLSFTMLEYIKSAAIYYYITPIASSLDYDIDISEIVKEYE